MKRETLTLQEFDLIEAGKVIDIGLLPNTPEGLFMTSNDQDRMICWVAKKGHANDWTIYCQWSDKSVDYILQSGDKVFNDVHIQRCVPCDSEVMKRYRF